MHRDIVELQTIDRALDVLCAFAAKDELGVSELARALSLPKSAVHRVIRTLAARRFLEQGSNRRYRLGLKVLELGNVCRLRIELVAVSKPILRDLSVQADCNSHLAKLDGLEVIDLLRIEYPVPLRIARSPMLRRPAHCTALGKALLAFGDPRLTEKVLGGGLTRLTSYTITKRDRFLAELERIRKCGYAVDNEEFYAGTRCIAAPIFDESGQALAALSVSALITQITEDRVILFAALVMESARRISARLGYEPDKLALEPRAPSQTQPIRRLTSSG